MANPVLHITPLKICIICAEYPPGPHGGIGTIVQLAARKFVSMGHSVKVIGVYEARYGGDDRFSDNGVEVYRLRQGSGKFSFIPSWYRQFRQIKKWAEEGEIDIVEAPESRGWFAFYPALKIPCVIRAHGSETDEKLRRGIRPNRLTRMLESLSYKRADAASAVSNFSKQSAEKIFKPKKPLEIIYHGIRFVDMPVCERDKNTIVFAGALAEKKGVITLVKATSELFANGTRFPLLMFGNDTVYNNGSMIEYLKSLMPEGMEEYVKFYGHVTREELFDIYSRCTMAVFPSQWESFGLTPIEAMMCGCPVIHTTIPTGYELIDDGINGILTDPYDHFALAEKIRLLFNDEKLRKKLGANGIVKVKNAFSLDVMCNKLLAFYVKTIKEFKQLKGL